MRHHFAAVTFSAFFFVLPSTIVFGQTRQPASASVVDEKELAKYLQKESERPLPTQAIEGSIDPATYLVGPGDVLKINFWGLSSEEALGLSIQITPEGKMLIPSVGVIDVNNKTLQRVQEDVVLACGAKYDPHKVKITTHLTQLRLVRAHIYGEVRNPGFYTATAIDRIAHYISEAAGWTEWADEQHVEVRHLDGTVDTLDLSKLYQKGELSQNAYIRGGDVIYFPRIELTDNLVYVDGEIPFPGPHRITKDETVIDFLHRIEALNRGSDLEEFFLVRRENPPSRLNFFGNSAEGVLADTTRLKPGDHIFIPARREFVYVMGSVQKPGNFPYHVGNKALDYIGMAGATAETGNLESVKIIHRDSSEIAKGLHHEVRRGDTIIVPASSRTKITQLLAISSQIATLLIAAKAVGAF